MAAEFPTVYAHDGNLKLVSRCLVIRHNCGDIVRRFSAGETGAVFALVKNLTRLPERGQTRATSDGAVTAVIEQSDGRLLLTFGQRSYWSCAMSMETFAEFDKVLQAKLGWHDYLEMLLLYNGFDAAGRLLPSAAAQKTEGACSRTPTA